MTHPSGQGDEDRPWKSPREEMEERATDRDKQLAGAIQDRLIMFGHHGFAAHTAMHLDLVLNVINPFFARETPSTDEGLREALSEALSCISVPVDGIEALADDDLMTVRTRVSGADLKRWHACLAALKESGK